MSQKQIKNDEGKVNKIHIRVNSNNLKESFQKLSSIFYESISKKNEIIKSLKDNLKEQYNDYDKKTRELKKKCTDSMKEEKRENLIKYNLMIIEHDEIVENLNKEHEHRYNCLQKMYDDVLAMRELDQERLITYKQKYLEIKNHYNEVNYINADMSKQNMGLEKNNNLMKEELTNTSLKHHILQARFDELSKIHEKTSLLIKSLQNERTELRVDIEKSNGKMNMLNRDIATLEEEIKTLSKELGKEKVKSEKMMIKEDSEMNVKGEIIRLEEKIKSLYKELDKEKETKDLMKEESEKKLTKAVSALEEEIKTLSYDVDKEREKRERSDIECEMIKEASDRLKFEAQKKLIKAVDSKNQWKEEYNKVNKMYKTLKEQIS